MRTTSISVVIALSVSGCTVDQNYAAGGDGGSSTSTSANGSGGDGGSGGRGGEGGGGGTIAPTWKWMNPTPGSVSELRTVWGTASDDVWFAGDGGAILRWDGKHLKTAYEGAPSEAFAAIWASGPNDVWAAGDHLVAHYDGHVWSHDYLLGQHSVRAIWGDASDDAWAATEAGLFHWDGGAWETPYVGAATLGSVETLFGLATNDIWAAGSAGTIFHYDGSAWLGTTASWTAPDGINAFDETHEFLAVGGVATDDVWAVYDANHLNAGFAHWDGNNWQVQAELPFVNHWIAGTTGGSVVALATNDVYAVVGDGYAWHWDGTSWSPAPMTVYLPFCSMWGTPEAGIFLGAGDGEAFRVDADAGPIVGKRTALGGGEHLDFENVAVGRDGSVWGYDGAYRWTAVGWEYTNPPVEDVRGVDVRSADDVWMSGQTSVMHGDQMIATIVHYHGGRWDKPVLLPEAGASMFGISVVDRTHGYAVGTGGAIAGSLGSLVKWDGETWKVIYNDTTHHYSGVWAAAVDDVWLTTSDGVLHWDGSTMIDFPDGPRGGGSASGRLDAGWRLSGSAPDDVWACAGPAATGNSVTAACSRWNGKSWQPIDLETDQTVSAVWTNGANDVWLLTTNASYPGVLPSSATSSTIRHYDGKTARAVLEVPASLLSIAGADANDVWAVGSEGATLQYARHEASTPH